MNPITVYWIITAFCIFGIIAFAHIAEKVGKGFWNVLFDILSGFCITLAVVYTFLAVGLTLAESQVRYDACKKQGYVSAEKLQDGEIRCWNPNTETDVIIITAQPGDRE